MSSNTKTISDPYNMGWRVDMAYEKALTAKQLMRPGRWTTEELMDYLEAMYRADDMHDKDWYPKVNRTVDYLHKNELLRFEDGFYWNDK